MTPFRRTLRLRLGVGLGALVALLLAAGLAGIQALVSLHAGLRGSVGSVAELDDDLFRLHDATLRSVVAAQAALMGEVNGGGAMSDSLSDAADLLRRHLLAEASLTTEQRSRLEQVGALHGRVEVRLAVARAYREVGRPADAYRQAALAARTLDTLFTHVTAIQEAQAAQAETTLASIDALVSRRSRLLAALLFIGLAAAGGLGYLTWRAVTEPLGRLLAAVRAMGRGDLRVSLPSRGLDEEFQLLAYGFGDMARRLADMVAEIQREARAVADAAAALTAASEQSAGSSGQISQVVQEIARDAEAQRLGLASSTSAVESLGDAGRALDEAVRETRVLAQEIRDTAQRNRAEVVQALATLGRAREVVSASARQVAALEGSSEEIGRFAATVATVASQTNLLALNAAIEAARAGEHGRGFAVVAEEVRKLAVDSERSAEEAKAVVAAMREEVAAVARAFRRGAGDLGDVDSVSQAAAAALAAIEASVARVDRVTAAVEEAAGQIQRSIASLVERLGESGVQAESQAAASQEAAAAAEETAATAEEVAATAHALEASAARLRASVSVFQT